MSHQYRAWRDHISRCIEDVLSADHSYALLHTSSMVGLFSCVFVKTSIRSRVKQVHASEIKRGMGGLHGNKVSNVAKLCFKTLLTGIRAHWSFEWFSMTALFAW